MIFNIAGVQLEEPAAGPEMAQRLQGQVARIEAVDRRTAYEATPGYSEQQSTLNTQQFFTLFIGVLVVGGFFQIQTLQKVAQVGMLKAIGASTGTIVIASLMQIVMVNLFGVAIGALGTLALALSFPAAVPIVFTAEAVALSLAALILIGPISGLVSVRILLKVEPLTALGLAS